MMNGFFKKLSVPVFFLFLFSLFACGTAKTVYRAGADTVNAAAHLIIPGEKPVLKKKVLVAPVINQTGINSGLDEIIRQGLISYLEKDKYLLVSRLEKAGDEKFNPRTLQYGIVIDNEQVKKAQEAGMNILISCVFHPIELDIERKGIWPFRKNRRIVGVSISVNAIDTTDNTLVVSKNESVSLKTDEINPDDTIEWKTDINLIERGVNSVLKGLSTIILEEITQHPWQSMVNKSDSDTYIIKAGHDVGIDNNTVFELYAKGESIKSFTRDEYYILGDKLGEAHARSISKDESVLGITPGSEQFINAEIIRVKRP
jgi:hypothetical protein